MALLDVILGYACNLACDYCTQAPSPNPAQLPAERVLQEMKAAFAQGYHAVSFTGGEPTLRPELVGLVRAARQLGFADVKLQSNGLVLAHPPNVDRLLEAGVSRFHVSVHTHLPEAYDALVRREGSFPLMAAALDNLTSRGAALTADLILKEDTYRRLPDAVRWLHGKKVQSLHLWFVSLTDANRLNVASMPRMTEVLPFVRQAFSLGRTLGLDVRSLHLPRCLLGADADRAYDPGADRVRVVTPEATFELKDSKLAGNLFVPGCEDCRWHGVCPGVRQDYVQRHGHEEFVAEKA